MIKEKSPLFYNGNKYILLDKIYQHIPKNPEGTFYDLFGGSGTMALNFSRLYKKAIYNEYDPMVYKMFRWALTVDETALKSLTERILELDKQYGFIIWDGNYDDFKKKNPDITKTKEYAGWNKFIEMENVCKDSDPELLWITSCYAFSCTLKFNENTGMYNNGFGVTTFKHPNDYNFIKANGHKNIETHNGSFHDIDIDNINQETDFVYLDPPYLITKNNGYDKFWTEQDQKNLYEFCEKLNDRGIKFALSGVFENKGIINTSMKRWSTERGWKVWTFDHKYTVNGSTGYAQEVLICNYEYAEDGIQLDLFGGMGI